MSKGPKGPRNPMGWGNDDPRKLQKNGRHGRTMHGSKPEYKLMSGLGALIKQDAGKVKVTGEKPGSKQRRRPLCLSSGA